VPAAPTEYAYVPLSLNQRIPVAPPPPERPMAPPDADALPPPPPTKVTLQKEFDSSVEKFPDPDVYVTTRFGIP
jgi:hypothetical protein